MSVDWHRMQWQYRANVCAEIARCVCILMLADEWAVAVRYHFPLWDDIAGVITAIVMQMSWWVDRHTRMYRFDLDK